MTTKKMTRQEEHDVYADPGNQTPQGPARRTFWSGSVGSQGRRLRVPMFDRTTVKCRWSSVAMSLTPSRSAAAITDASTVPSGRSAYCATSSAMRNQSDAATGSAMRLPAARSPRKRTSGSAPRRVPRRWATSVTTRVGTISGPGCVSSRSRLAVWCRSSRSMYAYNGPASTISAMSRPRWQGSLRFARRCRYDHWHRRRRRGVDAFLAAQRAVSRSLLS
jgi:hypothetical protein